MKYKLLYSEWLCTFCGKIATRTCRYKSKKKKKFFWLSFLNTLLILHTPKNPSVSACLSSIRQFSTHQGHAFSLASGNYLFHFLSSEAMGNSFSLFIVLLWFCFQTCFPETVQVGCAVSGVQWLGLPIGPSLTVGPLLWSLPVLLGEVPY